MNSKSAATKSPLSQIISKYFNGLRFYPNTIKIAGKILKNRGEEDCVSFLIGKGLEKLNDFQPPAKALIVAKSRQFSEWPIVKASNAIQSHIYGLSSKDFSIPGTSKEEIHKWVEANKIDLCEYHDVQGLNLIFNHAKAIYEGVGIKVENRNKKNKAKIDRENIHRTNKGLPPLLFEEEKVFNENDKLCQPPGINNSIYCYKNISPKVCKSLTHLIDIQTEYTGYYRNPDELIKQLHVNHRLNILSGMPGYVPEWQRSLLSKKPNKRFRKWYSNQSSSKYTETQIKQAKADDALLCQIKIGNDWLLFDARGLLRNLQWRKLVPPEGISLNDILKQFTGDPVIDPEKNIVTFVYKPNIVGVHSERIISYKKAPELIKKLTTNASICLVSVDLGQTNPVSCKFSTIKQENKSLTTELIDRQFLPDFLLKEIFEYREKSDSIIYDIKNLAFDKLNPEYKEEFNKANTNNSPEVVLKRICDKLNIDISKLPRLEMTAHSTYIADLYLETGGDPSVIMFVPNSKKGAAVSQPIKIKDFKFAKDYKVKISKEARDEMSKVVWELQRESQEYKKLSQRKKEFTRRCVNHILKEAKQLSGCEQIVFNIENLNIDNRVFSGSGKREEGWDNFFTPKKENRWFIQGLHKSFTELAHNRGINVIESNPARTSITCDCGYCDKNNRDGEKFKCLKCGKEANTDLEIATDNIEKVALTGKSMPKPTDDCERCSDTEKPIGARNGKNSKNFASIGDGKETTTIDDQVGDNIKNNSTRKPLSNAA